jgi:hypothetical protein
MGLFRSNMSGPTDVLAVEGAKADYNRALEP